MKLTFLGAAGEVTGSCFLVETGAARFLVDCGMFQGGREAARKNREAFDFDLRALDFVLLTHAHIDHSGLLPRLSALGYRGPVHATRATADLLSVMLPDSAYVQEKEAEWAIRHRHRERRGARHEQAPLYTVAQAQACLRQLRGHDYGAEFAPHPSLRCVFRNAGHILGSAIVELWTGENRKLVFSGDLGQPGHPIVQDPDPVREADLLLVESTYGNRLHRSLPDTLDELEAAIRDTLERRGGNVIVPAFAVGRTQDLLFLLADLHRKGRLPEMHIYVDSPMAMSATEITLRHRELFDEEAATVMQWLRKAGGRPRVSFVQDAEESKALNAVKGGAVIISASGMCEAGRIRHHLRHNLARPECGVLITGFQALGTLGRRLVDGAKTVKLFGEEVPVRASLHTLGGLSAHADREGLLGWLGHFRSPPRQTFVVHGEAAIAASFADAVRSRLGWAVTIPGPRASFMM
ncbi:MAG TPA: MBL fold metallo-hydrolase [Burkholderiales bacterium]